jgi:hypothetical protein
MDTNGISIRLIEKHELPLIFNLVVAFLDAGIDKSYGELNIKDIEVALHNDTMALLCILKGNIIIGAFVIQINEYSNNKKLVVVTASGIDLKSWVDLVDEKLIEIAKECKCSELKIVGRDGWSKLLRSRGWDKVYSVLTKKVK